MTLAAWVSLPDVMNFENPENPPAAKFTARLLEADNPSLIVVRLVLNGPFLDALSVGSHRSFNYTDGHARLLALLREPASLAPSNCLRYREGLKLLELLADDNRYLQDQLMRISGEEIIGADFGLKGVMDLVKDVAPLDSPVIVLGETATGKELTDLTFPFIIPSVEGSFYCG